jgi:hypothetical protein
VRAADVRALYELLDEDLNSIEAFRERLRQIIAPERPEIHELPAEVYIPRMD